MNDRTHHVLFLCTGNSARSIMAESLLNHWGKGRFHAFSAGSQPKGQVHPLALELLQQLKLPTAGLRSKSWDEFSGTGAPPLDFVFTVCDDAAGETCPYWPGHPMTGHWGIADPAAVEGSDEARRQAFRHALLDLESRIELFTSLPLATIDRMALQAQVDAIGRMPPAPGMRG